MSIGREFISVIGSGAYHDCSQSLEDADDSQKPSSI
jgi:hypothetical protein